MSALTATVAALPRAGRIRPRPGLILAGLFAAVVVAAALVPQLLAPHDPLEIGIDGAFLSPRAGHLLGTDESGRDVLSRMVYGARPSLVMGLGATAIAVAGGTVLGLIAGLGSRLTESLIMRLIDVVLSVPELLLALVVITLAGAGSTNAMFAVAFASIPSYARIVRAQTHIVRRSTFVEAATGLGIRRSTVVWRHVLPNAIRPVLVLSTIGIGTAISAGAALSFLGLGTEPPAAEWGDMLSNGLQYISNDWLLVAVPGVAITLTVLSITVLGRELRRRSEGRTT
ncbi:ABC transporter permease [Streptosporangium lutulentum]|uniref:Peptide/nickel transport system permease protein n=1 Tax=Streptosporangium lutulentum TaxID=1461250 RepID=A0ABT9Q6Y2_9ACTN|nr:ABC transporter permease [Streptosporangium lutulentum]MDP9842422.1 peptide/nickel transport system permease protein [Streptosporangium lutulentum]